MCSIREAAKEAYADYASARGRLLRRVADLGASGEWRGDGAGSLASWMAAHWQISLRTARDLVRDAEALDRRPALAAALEDGSISVDQAKALGVLCREGTDDEHVWLETLPFWSYFDLEREARKAKARELERRDDGVYLRLRTTEDERYVRGEFQLHPEEGAAVQAAIDARVPEGTPLRDWDHASAIALVEMTKDTLAGNGTADRATVLVSVDEATLAQDGSGDIVARLGSGDFVGADTARRLACDARIQPLLKDAADRITGIGYTSRSIPPWLRRAVEDRDHGMCTFPGCGSTRYLECHHIIHWVNHGPTELWNLLTTCWNHHQLLHEGLWSVTGEAGPHITWIRPDGTPYEPRIRVTLDTC